jgi:mannose-6-phosphate isomerase
MKPIHLTANQPPARFYAGGPLIADFRGLPPLPNEPEPHTPEDWLGSTTSVFGSSTIGLTELPDGRVLKDAIESEPARWLGARHVEKYGTDIILVKLLDAGERLPVHIHPDAPFAKAHLGVNHGKSEGWIALSDADAHIAFTRDVSEEELHVWVKTQDVDAILGVMHKIPIHTGDAVYLPAGLPHAIGAGNFVVELQEPTDLSILLEWKDFPIDGTVDGHVGLGFDVALQAVDRRGRSREEVLALSSAPDPDGNLFPGGADFFRAHRLSSGDSWDSGFAVAIVVAGDGLLRSDVGSVEVSRGDTVLIPYAAGGISLEGTATLDVVLCRPPA